ncbi:Spy/CpxP family protein refolding chaperone [Hydrogenispora ethanolica]|uniref:Spy/CpxP family protein refolding chaperone n=1 Tax=Hydrogenispora ethanolica TaxID=1082276 RepID=A0A4R1SBS1_HYDET|nr:Spy/CpxP family protein refolding chaperone [Hydrogenispora ethanolica]TCL76869.1 Spy/CpxP family protein refolding chaperone [Hydrogenispora ethanolica]
MKKLGFILLTLALLVGSVSLAAVAKGPDAQTPPPPGSQAQMERPEGPAPDMERPKCGPRRGDWLDRLNLSFEQQMKVLEIRQNFEKSVQPLHFLIQKNEIQLRQLWSEKKLDPKAIEGKELESAAARVKIRIAERAMLDQIHAVLAPEQQKQLQELMMAAPKPGRGAAEPGRAPQGPEPRE